MKSGVRSQMGSTKNRRFFVAEMTEKEVKKIISWEDKKSQLLNFSTSQLLFFVFCLLFSVFCLLPPNVFAQNQRDEYRKLQQELKTQKQKLESAKKVERSAIEELRKVTRELNDIETRLTKQRNSINRIEGNISELQTNINNMQAGLNLQHSLLKKRLRALQRAARQDDIFLIIISGKDISQTLRLIRYIENISAYDYALINRYKEAVSALSKKQKELKRLSLNLKSKEAKLAKLEEDLKERKRERETLLVSARKERRSYELSIREMEEASRRLERIIREAERREKERRQRELQKKRADRREPTRREPAIRQEEMPHAESGFARLRGRLPWPVHGSIATQFGSQVDPLLNLPVFRSGIHINADRGTPVRAVHEGRVIFADEFRGYGQLVIISHGGGYHTLYGNLSRIFFQNGAIIKENAIIGETGESSALGINGVYFEIRHKGRPVDPQQWLRK